MSERLDWKASLAAWAGQGAPHLGYVGPGKKPCLSTSGAFSFPAAGLSWTGPGVAGREGESLSYPCQSHPLAGHSCQWSPQARVLSARTALVSYLVLADLRGHCEAGSPQALCLSLGLRSV